MDDTWELFCLMLRWLSNGYEGPPSVHRRSWNDVRMELVYKCRERERKNGEKAREREGGGSFGMHLSSTLRCEIIGFFIVPRFLAELVSCG